MKRIFFALLLLLPLLSYAQGGYVFTVAGDSIVGFSGDGGLATAASLGSTEGVWLDSAGDIFFTDLGNFRIRKINAATGIITTIAGTGTGGYTGDGILATDAEIYFPYGLFADNAGNCYFADRSNNRIRKIDAISGIINTVAGNGMVGFSGDGGQATNAKVNYPENVYIDRLGNMYITADSRIRKVSASTGIISTIAGTGTSGYLGDGGLATNAQIDGAAAGMIADSIGNLFFADRGNNAIRKINAITHIITTVAGTGVAGYTGDSGMATLARIYGPIGLSLDRFNNIIISDNTNNVIRKVDAVTGIITTIAGTGDPSDLSSEGLPALIATMHPEFLYINSVGTIYYSNFGRHICKIVFGSYYPVFSEGHTQHLNICVSGTSASIDSLLKITDTDTGVTETWSLIIPPIHGTASVVYSTLSTGGTITPSGLTYLPTTGYTGTDSFTVRITNGTVSDTTKIIVMVYPAPISGTIMGTDTICIADSTLYVDTSLGGTWISSSSSVASVSASGEVVGLSSGTSNISYSVTNFCGTSVATKNITVLSSILCGLSTSIVNDNSSAIQLYPNPATNQLIIKTDNTLYTTCTITNVMGQAVLQQNLTTAQTVVNVAQLPSGVYYVMFKGGEGNVVRKFVKM